MTTTTTRPVYVPDTAYQALVASLTTPITGPVLNDPVSRVKEMLGEIANIWPVSLLDDPKAVPGVIAAP
ncbi:hypothetical protein [Salipiger sp.]|uniref:hypothetical protein n=1 Tax=Salipiger sp. TaxID=2078585 RepID=UPI003A9795E4